MPEPIEIIFLGTGSSVPTLKRAHPSILFHRGKDYFLFDCGESAQLGLEKAGISPMKISKIFISHWHADHFAGLLPLIETLHLSGRKEPLEIYGPEASRFVDALVELSYWGIGFEIKTFDCNGDKKLFEDGECIISSVKVEHSVPAVGFVFQEKAHWHIDLKKLKKFGLKEGPLLSEIKEKGKINFNNKIIKLEDIASHKSGRKIIYSGDTIISKNLFEHSREADLLIHDSTFIEPFPTKSHSNIKDVAKFAKRYKVKKLVLTHFSRRYKNSKEIKRNLKSCLISLSLHSANSAGKSQTYEGTMKIKKEARKHFRNVIVAEDGLKIII